MDCGVSVELLQFLGLTLFVEEMQDLLVLENKLNLEYMPLAE
jgi:hypothetical protein